MQSGIKSHLKAIKESKTGRKGAVAKLFDYIRSKNNVFTDSRMVHE